MQTALSVDKAKAWSNWRISVAFESTCLQGPNYVEERKSTESTSSTTERKKGRLKIPEGETPGCSRNHVTTQNRFFKAYLEVAPWMKSKAILKKYREYVVGSSFRFSNILTSAITHSIHIPTTWGLKYSF